MFTKMNRCYFERTKMMDLGKLLSVKVFVLFLALGTTAVACTSFQPADKTIHNPKSGFVLELVPGKFYSTTTRWLIFELPIYPQVAVWLETAEGKYLGTIYVTEKVRSGNWMDAPAEGRPQALPVWSHLEKEDLDAVAGATPSGETTLRSGATGTLLPGKYLIKLETNRSYDYNRKFTPESSGVTGQPSLIYAADLDVGPNTFTGPFRLLGTGSLTGADGGLHGGLDDIDTAKELFSVMKINYQE